MAAVTAAAITAAAAVGGAALSARAQKKQAQAQQQALNAQSEANANMTVPEVARPQTAQEILAAYRNEVLGNFDPYSGAASMATDADTAKQRQAIALANPQYYSLLGQLSNNASSLNQGQLPGDVVQQITQQANQNSYLNGFTTGSGAGGNAYAGSNSSDANLLLRNLGLTSLDAMKLGSSLSGQVMQETRAGAGNVTSVASILPNLSTFTNAAQDQAQFQQALYNRDAAVANQPIQSNYLSQIGQAQGTIGDAATLAALGQGLTGLSGSAAKLYTAGQSATPKKTAVY